MDKKNKKSKREIIYNSEDSIEKIIEQEKKAFAGTQESTIRLHGVGEKFPEQNFVQLFSHQGNKKIKLQTYRYKAKGIIQGVVYLL